MFIQMKVAGFSLHILLVMWNLFFLSIVAMGALFALSFWIRKTQIHDIEYASSLKPIHKWNRAWHKHFPLLSIKRKLTFLLISARSTFLWKGVFIRLSSLKKSTLLFQISLLTFNIVCTLHLMSVKYIQAKFPMPWFRFFS